MNKNELIINKRKIDDMLKKINVIMNNRLIIAIFSIIDGLWFIIYPVESMNSMARTISFTAFCACFLALVTNIKSKDNKSIIMVSIMMAICITIFIFPKPFAINLKVLIALFIILNGLFNIFNIMKLDKATSHMTEVEQKIKDKYDNDRLDKKFDKNIIIEQTEKVINPITNAEKKINKKSSWYFVFNIVSIILGLLLFTKINITLVLCGVILLYTGIFDVFMYLKSRKILKKTKR